MADEVKNLKKILIWCVGKLMSQNDNKAPTLKEVCKFGRANVRQWPETVYPQTIRSRMEGWCKGRSHEEFDFFPRLDKVELTEPGWKEFKRLSDEMFVIKKEEPVFTEQSIPLDGLPNDKFAPVGEPGEMKYRTGPPMKLKTLTPMTVTKEFEPYPAEMKETILRASSTIGFTYPTCQLEQTAEPSRRDEETGMPSGVVCPDCKVEMTWTLESTYLSKFEPDGMQVTESPTMEVKIETTNQE